VHPLDAEARAIFPPFRKKKPICLLRDGIKKKRFHLRLVLEDHVVSLDPNRHKHQEEEEHT
jgi:hypothetical protein